MTKLKWNTGRLPEPEYLPTASFGINKALGGKGLRAGRVHVLWGLKASGKSTLALHLIAKAQREGKVCGYLDAEKTFDPIWAEKCGVDVDALKLVQANIAEDILELVLPDLKKHEVDVLVVDSLSSINFEAFFDVSKGGPGAVGSFSRTSKAFVLKVLGVLDLDQQVILISHASMDLSNMQYPKLAASLGNAVNHWASTIIRLTKSNAKDDVREEDGAHKVKWLIEKSKQSTYPVSGEFFFVSNTASIDNVDEIVTYARKAEIITGSGAWTYYRKGTDEELTWNGIKKTVAYVKEHPEFLEQLKSELLALEVVADEDDSELAESED